LFLSRSAHIYEYNAQYHNFVRPSVCLLSVSLLHAGGLYSIKTAKRIVKIH